MDVMPQAEGHVLVIPKEPAENILDLSPEGAAAMMATTQKVAKAVKKGLNAPGIMLTHAERRAGRPERLSRAFPHHSAQRRRGYGHACAGMVDAKTLEPIAAKIRSAL